MAKWNDVVITDMGMQLSAQTLAGKKIVYTHAQTTDLDLSGKTPDQIQAMTELTSVKQDIPISSISVNDKETVKIFVKITNEGVKQDYMLYGLAVFAKIDDNPEVLYEVVTAQKPDLVPALTGTTLSGINFSLLTHVAKSENASIIVGAGGLNEDEVLELINDHTIDLSDYATKAQLETKVTDLNNGLSTKVTDNKNGTIEVNGSSITPADDSTVLHNNSLNQIKTDNSGIIVGNDGGFGFIKRENYKAGIAIGSQNSFRFIATDDKVISNTSEYHDVWNISPTGQVSIMDGAYFTPADDSKVVHSTVTQLNSTDMNTIRTTGFYQLISGTNGMPNADKFSIYQVIRLTSANGVQVVYGTNNAILGMRSWNSYGTIFTSWVQFADDSKVAHLSGANNFDTVPTVNNNPLLLASSLPSDLARLSQDANFTAKLQQNGQDVALANNTIARNPNTGVVSKPTDFTNLTVNGGKSVATSDDLKSVKDSAWRELNFDVSQGNYKAFSAAKIVYKINRDEKYISFFFAGTPVGKASSSSTLVTDTISLVMDLSSVLTEISNINFQTEYGQISDNNSNAASLGYSGAKVVFTSQVYISPYLAGVTFLPKDYPDCRIYYTSLVNGI